MVFYEALIDIVQAYAEYRTQALLFGMAATVVYAMCAVVGALYRVIVKKQHEKLSHVLTRVVLFAILGFYMSYVFYLTLSGREAGSRDGINLKVLSTLIKNGELTVFGVENVLLFVPFGIFVPLIFKSFRKWYKTALLGFVISIIIESAQLITHRGYFELDDILLNTLGTIIGYLIYSFFSFAFSLGRSGSTSRSSRRAGK